MTNLNNIAVILLVGFFAIIAVLFWPPPKSESLRAALGNVFGRPIDLIELNIPPADGRYPGTVILTPRPGQMLPVRRIYRPDQIPKATSGLKLSQIGEAEAIISSGLVGRLESTGDIILDIVLNDLKLYEADLNQNFKNALLEDKDVYSAHKRGLKPRVIVRAYEAVMSLKVGHTSAISAEMWNKIKQNVLKTGDTFADDETMVVNIRDPVVVAYETMNVDYFSTTLSVSVPDQLELTDSIAMNSLSEALDISAFNLTPSTKDIRYELLGNANYDSHFFGDLRLTEPSLEIVEHVFKEAGAQRLLVENSTGVVTETQLNGFLTRIASELETTVPSLFVLYYAGHAIAGPGGQLYLVMSDYGGNPIDDFGEDFLLGSARLQMSELVGGNFDDILDVVSSVRAKLPHKISGLYPVSKLAQRLQESNTPFVILIDACYEYDEMDRLREELNLTESGDDYFGPDTYTEAQEFQQQYVNAIHQFSTAPYLNSTDVIIFSATPGSAAVAVKDPRPMWDSYRRVAPLASRIYKRFEGALVKSETVTWGDFLQSIVDVQRLGEIRTHGTVSWSDFEIARHLTMLSDRHLDVSSTNIPDHP